MKRKMIIFMILSVIYWIAAWFITNYFYWYFVDTSTEYLFLEYLTVPLILYLAGVLVFVISQRKVRSGRIRSRQISSRRNQSGRSRSSQIRSSRMRTENRRSNSPAKPARRSAANHYRRGFPLPALHFQKPVLLFGSCAAAIAALIAVGTVGYRFFGSSNRIPDSLIEFAEKYPEAAGYVSDYPKEHKTEHSMNIEEDAAGGEIPYFVQWDKRWGYKNYGSGLLGTTGCGPTCMSMVIVGLTGDTRWNPYEVAKYAEDHDYYVDGEGTAWKFMTDAAPDFGLTAETGDVDADYIMNNLSSNTPMICSMNPGDFTYTGHFIVLCGINEDGTIQIHDPNSPNHTAAGWDVNVLIPQMSALWKFQYIR